MRGKTQERNKKDVRIKHSMNRKELWEHFLRKDERHLRNRKGLHVSVLGNVQLFETPRNFPGRNTVVGFIPSLGDLPHPGIETTFLMFLALAGRFFATVPLGKAC